MKEHEPPFYTVEQIAKMLGKKESTVKRYFRAGILKGKRIGRVWGMTPKMFEEQISAEDERPSKPRKLSALTRNKMDLRAKKRSLDNLPGRIDELNRDIDDICEGLPDKPGPENGPAIQLLKDKIEQRGKLMEALATKDKKIKKMSSKAYPEIVSLFGMKRNQILETLEKGSGKIAPPLGETLAKFIEDDARRQGEAQKGFAPETQQQPSPKTMSVGGTEDQQPPERGTSPTDDGGTEQ